MKVDYEVIQPALKVAKQNPSKFKMIAELGLKSAVLKESIGVIYKDQTPIEKLPNDEKKDIWSFVCQTWPERTKEDKIKLSKIVYVLGVLF